MSDPAVAGDSATDRRRIGVVGVTAAVGMATLAWSLNTDPGSGRFYVATATLAIVWTAGAVLAGPGPGGRVGVIRPGGRRVAEPLVFGVVVAGIFVLGALVVRQIDVLADAVDDVLDYARRGSGAMVVALALVTAVAEELFFRGAVYDALPRRHAPIVSTLVYVLTTLASGRAVLAFAALVLGAALAGQRHVTGGYVGPAITHVTWSAAMLFVLPAIIDVA